MLLSQLKTVSQPLPHHKSVPGRYVCMYLYGPVDGKRKLHSSCTQSAVQNYWMHVLEPEGQAYSAEITVSTRTQVQDVGREVTYCCPVGCNMTV